MPATQVDLIETLPKLSYEFIWSCCDDRNFLAACSVFILETIQGGFMPRILRFTLICLTTIILFSACGSIRFTDPAPTTASPLTPTAPPALTQASSQPSPEPSKPAFTPQPSAAASDAGFQEIISRVEQFATDYQVWVSKPGWHQVKTLKWRLFPQTQNASLLMQADPAIRVNDNWSYISDDAGHLGKAHYLVETDALQDRKNIAAYDAVGYGGQASLIQGQFTPINLSGPENPFTFTMPNQKTITLLDTLPSWLGNELPSTLDLRISQESCRGANCWHITQLKSAEASDHSWDATIGEAIVSLQRDWWILEPPGRLLRMAEYAIGESGNIYQTSAYFCLMDLDWGEMPPEVNEQYQNDLRSLRDGQPSALVVNPEASGTQPELGISCNAKNDVCSVSPGGAAEIAGVETGDKLVAVNGTPISAYPRTLAELSDLIDPGDLVSLRVKRGTQTLIFFVSVPGE